LRGNSEFVDRAHPLRKNMSAFRSDCAAKLWAISRAYAVRHDRLIAKITGLARKCGGSSDVLVATGRRRGSRLEHPRRCRVVRLSNVTPGRLLELVVGFRRIQVFCAADFEYDLNFLGRFA
jgi:hypothetical protein